MRNEKTSERIGGTLLRTLPVLIFSCAMVQSAFSAQYTIDTSRDYIMIGSSGGVAALTNSISAYITVSNDVTISFKHRNGDKSNRRSYANWCIAGNVVFDFSDWDPEALLPLFHGSIVIMPEATLTLKYDGTKSDFPVALGRDGVLETGELSTYMLGGLLFEGVSKVQVFYASDLKELPTDVGAYQSISITANTGSRFGMGFSGTDTASPLIDGDGDVAFNNKDLCFYGRSAIPEGAGVKVSAGRLLHLRPAAYVGNSFGVSGLHCNRMLLAEPLSGWEEPVQVKAMGDGAKVYAWPGTSVTFADGLTVWSHTEDGVTVWEKTSPGARLSLEGVSTNKANAKISLPQGTTIDYVSASTPPLVSDGGAKIELATASAAPTVYANDGVTEIANGGAEGAFGGLEPVLWLDASVTNSLTSCTSRTNDTVTSATVYGTLYRYDENTGEYELVVEQWSDCRYADAAPYGSEIVMFQNYSYNNSTSYAWVYPYLVTQGDKCPNGMPYLCFGSKVVALNEYYGKVYKADKTTLLKNYKDSRSGARLSLMTKDGTSQTKLPSSQGLTGVGTVVMVFGSQGGGGAYPISVTGDKFKRCDTSSANATVDVPVTRQNDWPMWLNGEVVVPNETLFSGEWDILSICTTNLTLNGIGLGTTSTFHAGQNYAEIIFFAEELTDVQRTNVERYLALKWGLADKYESASAPVTSAKLMGVGTNGTVKVSADLELSGTFAGTIELNGANVTVANLKKPAAERDVPTDGCLGWYNPDAAGSFELASVDSGAISYVYNILNGTPKVGDVVPWGGTSRGPVATASARGFGAARTWFDFNGPVDLSTGNSLRLAQYSKSSAQPTESPFENVRTVVMVQDSCRGGGSPLKTALQGYPRRAPAGDWTVDIWASSSNASIANYKASSLRLDGVAIESSNGFNGCPEVFTVQAAPGDGTDLTVGAFANYISTDSNGTGSKLVRYGEIIGETILYSRDLTDGERADVESYLMNKWLNKVPEGYGDLSRATLTGTGSLSAAKWSQVPALAPDFEGTVSVAAVDAMAMSVGPDGVSGAIVCPDAKVELPAAVTVDVSIERSATVGAYTLIDCDCGDTDFTFNVSGARSRSATVSKVDGRWVLSIGKVGFCLIIE